MTIPTARSRIKKTANTMWANREICAHSAELVSGAGFEPAPDDLRPLNLYP